MFQGVNYALHCNFASKSGRTCLLVCLLWLPRASSHCQTSTVSRHVHVRWPIEVLTRKLDRGLSKGPKQDQNLTEGKQHPGKSSMLC